jgi:hypothetical protein
MEDRLSIVIILYLSPLVLPEECSRILSSVFKVLDIVVERLLMFKLIESDRLRPF